MHRSFIGEKRIKVAMKIVDNYKRGSIIELPTNSSVTRDFMSLQELPSAIRLQPGFFHFRFSI